MHCEIVVIFILIIIFALLFYSILPKLIVGGGDKKIENVLIVDVANMFVGWYMETHSTPLPFIQQTELFNNYIDFMSDHYSRFILKNDISLSAVHYVLKNYRCASGEKMIAPKIPKNIWKKLCNFAKSRRNAYISVAEDYTVFSVKKWKDKKNHYLRGRDDFLCFYSARQYKKKYIEPVIMSDDKYDDFNYFGCVPNFSYTYIYNNIVKCDITPSPKALGQIENYKIVPTSLDFSFKNYD